MKSPPPLPQTTKRIVIVLFFGLLGLLLATYMTAKSGAAEHCIFCNIIAGETPTTIEKETDDYVIFKDIKPASTHHYLAVTKRHVESIKKLTKADDKLIVSMEAGLKALFQSKGIDAEDALFGFHLPPFISVKHMHLHAIAPRSTMTFFNRLMFRPSSFWFRTVQEARDMLKDQ